jgi:hypothetical protein
MQLVQSKSKEVNVVDKDAELSKENGWYMCFSVKDKYRIYCIQCSSTATKLQKQYYPDCLLADDF